MTVLSHVGECGHIFASSYLNFFQASSSNCKNVET